MHLGLWENLSAHACPIHQVHVSTQGRFGAVRLSHTDIEKTMLGHVIPAQVINAAFNARLSSMANLTLLHPARLKKLHQDPLIRSTRRCQLRETVALKIHQFFFTS